MMARQKRDSRRRPRADGRHRGRGRLARRITHVRESLMAWSRRISRIAGRAGTHSASLALVVRVIWWLWLWHSEHG